MVQAVDPGAGANEPERQGAQEEAEMALGSGLARPAGQSVQEEGEDAPMNSPKAPAGHGNTVPPMQKEPGGHCWQEAAPEPE